MQHTFKLIAPIYAGLARWCAIPEANLLGSVGEQHASVFSRSQRVATGGAGLADDIDNIWLTSDNPGAE